MAMVSVVNWQGGLMVQADRLGPKVGGHLAPCCTHRVNHGELSQCFKHDDSTIKIVEVSSLLLLLLSQQWKTVILEDIINEFKTTSKHKKNFVHKPD